MALTPLMVLAHDRLSPTPPDSMDGVEGVAALEPGLGAVLIIGFGRIGQIASQPLLALGHRLSIIDTDTDMIRAAGQFGAKVLYGDGTRLDVLHAAGADRAALIVVATDKKDSTTEIVDQIKAQFPLVPVMARAFDRGHSLELINKGVDFQIRETFESALSLGRAAVIRLGATPDDADAVIEAVRSRDRDRFALQTVEGIYAGRDLLLVNSQQAASGH